MQKQTHSWRNTHTSFTGTHMCTDTTQVAAVSPGCRCIPLPVPKWLNKQPLCAQQPWLSWVVCAPLKKKYRKVPLVVPKFTCPVKTSLLSKLFLFSHMEPKFIMPLLSIQSFFFPNRMSVIIYVKNKYWNFICISGHRMLTLINFSKRFFFTVSWWEWKWDCCGLLNRLRDL